MQNSVNVMQGLWNLAAGALGALVAAYLGTTWALRKQRGEMAFARRLTWTEDLYATMDEVRLSLPLFIGTVSHPSDSVAHLPLVTSADLLESTSRLMRLSNKSGLYGSDRVFWALDHAGDAIVDLRAALRSIDPEAGMQQAVELSSGLAEILDETLDILAYEVRQHLGLATASDHLAAALDISRQALKGRGKRLEKIPDGADSTE